MPDEPLPAIPGKLVLTNRQLHELLRPVLPFTGAEFTFPVLNAVLLQYVAASNYLTASATDRYRLGIKRYAVAPENAMKVKDFAVLVSNAEARRILDLFRPGRRGRAPRLTLHVAGGSLVAEAITSPDAEPHALSTIKVGSSNKLDAADYPNLLQVVASKFDTLFGNAKPKPKKGAQGNQGGEPEPNGNTQIALNTTYVSALQEAARYAEDFYGSSAPAVFTIPRNPRDGVVAQIGRDFVALFMPVTVENEHTKSPHREVRPGWTALLHQLEAEHKQIRDARTRALPPATQDA